MKYKVGDVVIGHLENFNTILAKITRIRNHEYYMTIYYSKNQPEFRREHYIDVSTSWHDGHLRLATEIERALYE